MTKTTGSSTAVIDRDSVVAAAGNAKREIIDKRITEELERLMEGRQVYQYKQGEQKVPIVSSSDYYVVVAAPIIAEGDVSGCVLFISNDEEGLSGDTSTNLHRRLQGSWEDKWKHNYADFCICRR